MGITFRTKSVFDHANCIFVDLQGRLFEQKMRGVIIVSLVA